MFKITNKVKQNFVILFTLIFIGILLQVFLFLGNKSFVFSTKTAILMLAIFLLFSILEFILTAFIWIIVLDKLNQYVKQKLLKKICIFISCVNVWEFYFAIFLPFLK
ncbi:hypothetical protein [Candidatus Phytoplasma solani]|uniref:hypothetical protein n=1 Tax=Candidatus Phytoplasma solani TaxID=69896 RepID=UPI0003B7D6A6|nr:hypothetical protein [Candidatus Phytoplasma solani]CCP88376.1 hypothetical protein S284_04390 [Candidatus Phytoplasma solani]